MRPPPAWSFPASNQRPEEERRLIGDKTAIVGVGRTPFYRRGQSLPQTRMELGARAILAALADAGLTVRDVDGFSQYAVHHGLDVNSLARMIGVPEVIFSAGVTGGGNGYTGSIILAADAITAGSASVVVCFKALQQAAGSRIGQGIGGYGGSGSAESDFTRPYGQLAPAHGYALRAQRHMTLYGTQRKHFGQIAVQQRANANRRPGSIMRDLPMTMADYFNARMLNDPFCLFDYCLETDGAAALVLASAAQAASLRQPPVYILAAAQGGGISPIMPDEITGWAGHRRIAQRLFLRAGVGPKDIDVAEMYDHFSAMVLLQLEDFGFCAAGESGPFVEGGHTAWPDGDIPVNTHGGNLSDAYLMGLTHAIEAVEQLRGTAVNQVAGAELALVSGAPAASPQSALILRR